MAEISKKVIKPGFELKSTTDFRNECGGITAQALSYAINNDMVDYIKISDTVRIIVMTDKTKKYTPNASKVRKSIEAL